MSMYAVAGVSHGCQQRRYVPTVLDNIRDYDDYMFDDGVRDEPVSCPNYCNDGIVITCCDDLCVGAGECMHGDGEMICPTCNGEGMV